MAWSGCTLSELFITIVTNILRNLCVVTAASCAKKHLDTSLRPPQHYKCITESWASRKTWHFTNHRSEKWDISRRILMKGYKPQSARRPITTASPRLLLRFGLDQLLRTPWWRERARSIQRQGRGLNIFIPEFKKL